MKQNLIWLAALSMAFSGCQNQTIKEDRAGRLSVNGTLTNGGQVLEVEGRDIGLGMVKVQFLELNEAGELEDTDPEAEALVDAEGKFNVAAGGLLPGKYRVAVFQFDPYPGTDRLQGKFDAQNSPIIQEVSGDTRIEIDLSQY